MIIYFVASWRSSGCALLAVSVSWFLIEPILFLYDEESLVSTNLNSKLFRFQSAHPNLYTVMPAIFLSHSLSNYHPSFSSWRQYVRIFDLFSIKCAATSLKAKAYNGDIHSYRQWKTHENTKNVRKIVHFLYLYVMFCLLSLSKVKVCTP